MLAKIIAVTFIFIGMLIALVFAEERSAGWDHARSQHLRTEPACQWCGNDKRLEVHHIKPFHESPELELDQENMITLCRFCHFVVGHNCDFCKENLNVRKDCEYHRKNMK